MSKSMMLVSTLAALSLIGAVGCEKKAKTPPKAKVSTPKVDKKKVAPKKDDKKAAAKKADTKPSGDMTVVTVNTATSKIGWFGSKVVQSVGTHAGDFKKFEGKAHYNKAGELAKLAFTVDTTSITSDSEKLTGHLKNKDFFDVANHPKASFETTAIKAAAKDKFTHEITGDMTILGKKKSVTFPATVKVEGDKLVADTKFSINRDDFGMGYGAVDEKNKSLVAKLKDKAIAKAVVLTIHLEAPAPKK